VASDFQRRNHALQSLIPGARRVKVIKSLAQLAPVPLKITCHSLRNTPPRERNRFRFNQMPHVLLATMSDIPFFQTNQQYLKYNVHVDTIRINSNPTTKYSRLVIIIHSSEILKMNLTMVTQHDHRLSHDGRVKSKVRNFRN